MGSTDLISQRRGWVITCHFNNVFYCLQALVVPNKSNGGFNAKWNRERGIGSRQRRRKVKADWIEEWLNFILHALLFLQFHAVDFAEGLQGGWLWAASRAEQVLQMDTKPVSLATWRELRTVLSERRIDSFGLCWKKNQTLWTISQKRRIC